MTSWMMSSTFFAILLPNHSFKLFKIVFMQRWQWFKLFKMIRETFWKNPLLYFMPLFWCMTLMMTSFCYFAKIPLSFCFEYLSCFLGNLDCRLEFLKMIRQAFFRKSFFIPHISNVWRLRWNKLAVYHQFASFDHSCSTLC